MTEPNLTGNAPITKIVHPVKINFFKSFGMDLDFFFAKDSFFDCFNRKFLDGFFEFGDFFVYINKPLFGGEGFNNFSTTISNGGAVRIVFINVVN